MGHGSGYLLYRITEALFHTSRPILNNLGKNISDLENRIFDDTPDYHTVRELAIHRRNVLHFRRIIDPQRYLMSNLSHVRKPFLDETMSLYFDDLSDYLSKFWAIITTYRDTIDGLHVTVESLLTQRTNKVIGALTVISVALLPLTLLSGIYGMNIPLPYQESPLVIFLMFGLLTTIILSSIAMMRHKRLL
jgi:magnesium transporter